MYLHLNNHPESVGGNHEFWNEIRRDWDSNPERISPHGLASRSNDHYRISPRVIVLKFWRSGHVPTVHGLLTHLVSSEVCLPIPAPLQLEEGGNLEIPQGC